MDRKESGSLGGRARADKLSPEQRRKIALLASSARKDNLADHQKIVVCINKVLRYLEAQTDAKLRGFIKPFTTCRDDVSLRIKKS